MGARTADEDKTYFAFRKSLEARPFDLSDLDHFSLFVGVHNIARKKFILDEFEKTLDVTGNIYEFGSWRGSTLVLLASWYRLRRPQGNKIIFGFDSFEGLAAGTAEDGGAQGKYTGKYKADEQGLREVITARGLDPFVRLVVGDASTTCKAHFSEQPFNKVSFALLDMDLYEPTKAAIEQLLPNLLPGGRILFDEGTVEEWEGEQRALSFLTDEANKLKIPYTLEENSLTRQPTTVFTRQA